MKSRMSLCALMILGSGCTTLQPVIPLAEAPKEWMEACQRPQVAPVPVTAAQALSVVTKNYSEHHKCADKLDALQEWVRKLRQIK